MTKRKSKPSSSVHREKGLAFLFGVHLTPWHWRDGFFSRWLVFYIGPWRVETELVRHMEEHDI